MSAVSATVGASPSYVVANNDLTLAASQLPNSSFGFFLTSRSQGFVMGPGGSQGNLCVGGAIGRRATGRTGVMRTIRVFVVRFARSNPMWGYSRIQRAIGELGHQVGRTTVARILKSEGIKPAPERPSSWSAFIKATWGECAAADFFTTEVWTPRGLKTFHTLFVLDIATRRVLIAGTTRTPNEGFMAQVARNLTDVADGFLRGHRKLIVDRDTKFTRGFQALLASGGVETIFTPPRSPNCNAYAERFVRSIKEECLRRMIFFGEASLRRALREYVEHFNAERPHQGLGNRVIDRPAEPRSTSLRLVTGHERRGGLLRHYRASA